MNQQNPLEKQLESWTPRRPSEKVKQRLFRTESVGEIARAPIIPLWVKLASACCMLLLVTLFCFGRHDESRYLAVASGSNIMANLSSNLLALATDTQGERLNVFALPVQNATFDWTKSGHFMSTTGSFPSWKTNKL